MKGWGRVARTLTYAAIRILKRPFHLGRWNSSRRTCTLSRHNRSNTTHLSDIATPGGSWLRMLVRGHLDGIAWCVQELLGTVP
jgi:hypothetical protein